MLDFWPDRGTVEQNDLSSDGVNINSRFYGNPDLTDITTKSGYLNRYSLVLKTLSRNINL